MPTMAPALGLGLSSRFDHAPVLYGLDEASTSMRNRAAARRGKQRLFGLDLDQKKRKVKDVLTKSMSDMALLFQYWDKDGSGLLDRQEFERALRTLCDRQGVPLSSAVFDALWHEFDADGSGSISYEEWIRFALSDLLTQGNAKILNFLQTWDTDNSGTIDKNEFCRAVAALGFDAPRVHVEEVFDGFDADSSGSLTFQELNRLLRQQSTHRLASRLRAGSVSFEKGVQQATPRAPLCMLRPTASTRPLTLHQPCTAPCVSLLCSHHIDPSAAARRSSRHPD